MHFRGTKELCIHIYVYIFIYRLYSRACDFFFCMYNIYILYIYRQKKKKNAHQVKRRIQDGRWGLGEGETFDYTTHRDWAGKRKENKTKYSSNRGKKKRGQCKTFYTFKRIYELHGEQKNIEQPAFCQQRTFSLPARHAGTWDVKCFSKMLQLLNISKLLYDIYQSMPDMFLANVSM